MWAPATCLVGASVGGACRGPGAVLKKKPYPVVSPHLNEGKIPPLNLVLDSQDCVCRQPFLTVRLDPGSTRRDHFYPIYLVHSKVLPSLYTDGPRRILGSQLLDKLLVFQSVRLEPNNRACVHYRATGWIYTCFPRGFFSTQHHSRCFLLECSFAFNR